MTDEPELWRPILGFEANYAVSNAGRVKRLTRGNGTRPGRILKTGNRRGYRFFALSVDSVTSYKSAHRLVYEAFCGPIPDGMQINHKNGDKADNHLENLELMTAQENTQHAYRVLGVPLPLARLPYVPLKITNQEADDIRRRYAAGGISQTALANEYGISQISVSRIVARKIRAA